MSQQISPLRQRMIEDMTIRNMSPSTQKVYVAAVANFSIFHGRSPDKLTFEDVRDYRLHLISRGLKPNSINPIMGALRFFYRTTLGLKEVSENIPYARRADPLPAVLARDEVERFLKAVPNLKMRTAFITIANADSGKPCPIPRGDHHHQIPIAGLAARGFVQQGFCNAAQWRTRGLALGAGRRRNLIIVRSA
jgi:Phage integrase, N-terminal SAM-like domain